MLMNTRHVRRTCTFDQNIPIYMVVDDPSDLKRNGHCNGWTEVPNILQIRFLKKKQRSTSGDHLVWVGISAMLIKLFEHILVISKSSLHIGTTSTIVLSI
jgi:hypothetical protein